MSGFNSFISTNRAAIDASGNIDGSKLVFGKGRMLPPTVGTVATSGMNKTFPITNPTTCKYALPTDRLYVVCLDSTTNAVYYSGITNTTRGTGTTASVVVTLGNGYGNSASTHNYVGYVRADGSEVSGSTLRTG